MKDAYIDAFYGVIKQTQTSSGYELPEHIESYIVILLASHIEKVNFLPNNSFAETYLNLTYKDRNAKDLGDTCLFVSGVFPAYGNKHGINRRYYQDVGISSYQIASSLMNEELFTQLSDHFYFLSDFIEQTVSNPKLPHNNLFR